MHAFQLNLLNGIPDTYNIAVIDDIKDIQGTIQGLLNSDIKPFDGATFVNPFIVLLENYSLGGAKAGVTKKQFVHFKNPSCGDDITITRLVICLKKFSISLCLI